MEVGIVISIQICQNSGTTWTAKGVPPPQEQWEEDDTKALVMLLCSVHHDLTTMPQNFIEAHERSEPRDNYAPGPCRLDLVGLVLPKWCLSSLHTAPSSSFEPLFFLQHTSWPPGKHPPQRDLFH